MTHPPVFSPVVLAQFPQKGYLCRDMKNAWLRYIMMCVVTLTLIAPLLGGCGGRVTDPKLVRADSLMDAAPDSALALLLTIDSSRLDGRANQAYYALLLTQARYKCYIPATGDSLINIAVDYYDHWYRDRNKRTRSLLYLGCVKNELGFPSDAIASYLRAETAADPDDYNLLAQINFRIGYLYTEHYELSGRTINRFKKALDYNIRTGNKSAMVNCLNNIGRLTSVSDIKKGITYLERAVQLAKEIRDTDNYVLNLCALSNSCFYDSAFLDSKRCAMLVIEQFPDRICNDVCYSACCAYARLGMVDSAQMMFDLAGEIEDSVEPIVRMRALSEIALAKKDYQSYAYFKEESEKMSDVVEHNENKLVLTQIEIQYDKNQNNQKERNHLIAIISILALSLLAVLLVIITNHRKVKRQINDILELKARLEETSHSELLEKISQLELQSREQLETSENLKQLRLGMEEMVMLLKNIANISYHAPRTQLAESIREVLIVNKQNENREFCQGLYHYVDLNFNQIITKTKTNYPNLTNDDIYIIALLCCGFSYLEITFCMGYANKSYINVKKRRIAQAMNLNCTLDQYVGKFKELK